MRRPFARLLPVMALLLLAIFVGQTGVIVAEEAGVVCCNTATGDLAQQTDGDGHCCSHAHPSPFHSSSPLSIGTPVASHRQSFPRHDALAPEGPFRAIEQPPKLA